MIKSIAKVISEGIKYLTLLQKTSHVRRMRKAVDYGERFILLSEELGDMMTANERKRIKSRLRAIRKAFFKYNQ
tara:strand:+ start:68 stop:289 length:222 start_codon:yes stop_codon:yes gene_type:complete